MVSSLKMFIDGEHIGDATVEWVPHRDPKAKKEGYRQRRGRLRTTEAYNKYKYIFTMYIDAFDDSGSANSEAIKRYTELVRNLTIEISAPADERPDTITITDYTNHEPERGVEVLLDYGPM